jgi:hypothetical protein
MVAKKTILVLVSLVVLLIVGSVIYFFQYGLVFPPCSVYELDQHVPDVMKTSDMIFEKQKYYVITPESKKEKKLPFDTCRDTREDATGQIMDKDEDNFLINAGYEVISIEKGMRFRLVRRVDVHANGIGRSLSGNWGDTYLLKDENGKEWYIDPLYFKNLDRSNKNESKWAAGYYVGETRIGDVIVDR